MKLEIKRKILLLWKADKTPEWIARRLQLPQTTVNYYLRTYASGTRYHIKYDLDVLEALVSAKDRGTLDSACELYSISRAGALNLISKYRTLDMHRMAVTAQGYFNPAKLVDCWAVGLPFHHVKRKMQELANIKLRVVIDEYAAYLEANIPHKKRRYALTLDEEIDLLQHGLKWIDKNAARIRDNWQRVRRKPRGVK